MYLRNPNCDHLPHAGTSLALCCSITLTVYTQVNENYWDLTFQGILGKLYVISLFVTL